MTLLIILFGAVILLAGLTLLINPDVVLGFIRNNSGHIGLQILAAGVRLVLGVLLIMQADVSRYPLVITILGWIAVVAGAFLAIIGRRKFTEFMTWTVGLFDPYGRLGGIFAAVFGAFLIHAFV